MIILVFCSSQERATDCREQPYILHRPHNEQRAGDLWARRADHGEWHCNCRFLFKIMILMILVMILMMTMMLLCSVVFVVYKMQPKLRYVWWNWPFLRVSAAEQAIRVSIHISFDNVNVLFDNIQSIINANTSVNSPAAQPGCRGNFEPQNKHPPRRCLHHPILRYVAGGRLACDPWSLSSTFRLGK